jgi:hypothetical protein
MPAVFEDLQVRTRASIDGLLNRYTVYFGARGGAVG